MELHFECSREMLRDILSSSECPSCVFVREFFSRLADTSLLVFIILQCHKKLLLPNSLMVNDVPIADVPSGRDAQPVKAVHRAGPVNRRYYQNC